MAVEISDDANAIAASPARAQAGMQRKNKMFAMVLACVAALVFVTVVTLVLLMHYADLQLPQL